MVKFVFLYFDLQFIFIDDFIEEKINRKLN